MRKIVQISCGNYSHLDDEKDFDEQRYSIVALCDDGSIWVHNVGERWMELDTSEVVKNKSRFVSLEKVKK